MNLKKKKKTTTRTFVTQRINAKLATTCFSIVFFLFAFLCCCFAVFIVLETKSFAWMCVCVTLKEKIKRGIFYFLTPSSNFYIVLESFYAFLLFWWFFCVFNLWTLKIFLFHSEIFQQKSDDKTFHNMTKVFKRLLYVAKITRKKLILKQQQ